MKYKAYLKSRIEEIQRHVVVMEVVSCKDTFEIFVKKTKDSVDLKQLEFELRDRLSMPGLLVKTYGE